MNKYIVKFLVLATFVFVVFLGTTNKADAALSLSFGFGTNTYSAYGSNNGYGNNSYYSPYDNYYSNNYSNSYDPYNTYYGNGGYNNGYYRNTPINCYTSGYPCGNSYGYGNNNYGNNGYANNNYYNNNYGNNGYRNNQMFSTYNGGGSYYEYNPIPTSGNYINNNMCSYWVTNC